MRTAVKATDAPPAATGRPSPFKFLNAYEKSDKDIFFGRQDEIEQLYQLIYQSNLVLVYGKSGTGKTSLIECGLANRLLETDWYELYLRRRDDINKSLHTELRKPDHALTPIDEGASIVAAVQSLYLDHLKPIYLIFDQLEELFILGEPEEREVFFRTLADLLKSNVACKMILVMRDEYISLLDAYEPILPTLFQKKLRVEYMRKANLEQVIRGTTAAVGIDLEPGFENAVVEAIIESTREEGRRIVQLPYLQVYLDALYRQATGETNGQPMVFTRELVNQVGRLEKVMSDFLKNQKEGLEEALHQKYPDAPKDLPQRILGAFVSPEDTKKPASAAELTESLRIPAEMINFCLYELEKRRIVRNVEGVYELSHDSLAAIIADMRSADERLRVAMENMVKSAYESHQTTKSYLTEEQVHHLRPYFEELALDEAHRQFFRDSIHVLNRKRRWKRRGIMALIGALILALISVVWVLIAKENLRQQKIYEKNLLTAKQLEEKAGLSIQQQHPREFQKAWLYTLAALGQDLRKTEVVRFRDFPGRAWRFLLSIFGQDAAGNAPSRVAEALPLSGDRLIKLGVSAGVYNQIWVSPGLVGLINDLEVSRDGQLLVLGSSDGTVRMANLVTGEELFSPGRHSAAVTDVVISPDGGYIASAAKDKTVMLWQLIRTPQGELTGVQLLAVGKQHEKDVRSVAFSPNGSYLVSAGKDKKIFRWTIPDSVIRPPESWSAEELPAAHQGDIRSVAFSPDGKLLVSAATDKTVQVWKMPDAELPEPLAYAFADKIWQVAFSHDGRRLAVSTEGGEVLLFRRNGSTFAWQSTLSGHRGDVWQTDFSPNDSLLASASEDGTIRIWSVDSGRELRQISDGSADIFRVRFTPSGNHIVSCAKDCTVRIWQVTTGECLATTAGHRDDIAEVTFRPPDDLQLASTGNDGQVIFWNAQSGAGESRLAVAGDSLRELVFTPDGQRLAAAGTRGRIYLWQLDRSGNAAAPADTLRAHRKIIRRLAISPDGRRLASASDDQTVTLWDLDNIEKQPVRWKHPAGVRCVTFSPGGDSLLSGDAGGRLYLWDVKRRREMARWYAHDMTVNDVLIHPNGRWLISAADDDQVRIWDMHSPDFRKLIRLAAYPFDLTEQDSLQPYTYETVQWRKIKIRFRKKIANTFMKPLRGHEDDVRCVALSKDGRFLVSGSADEDIRIWDMETGNELATLAGHRDGVEAVSFHHSRHHFWLASASRQHIRLWNIRESFEVDQLPVNNGAGISAMAMNPADPEILVTADDSGHLKKWRWERRSGAAEGPLFTLQTIEKVRGSWGKSLQSLAFSPEGKWLAFGSTDNMVRLVKEAEGQYVAKILPGHREDGLAVAFSPDSRYVASGSSDGRLRVWQLKEGAELVPPVLPQKQHENKIRSVAFSPGYSKTETRIATGGSDKKLMIFKVMQTGGDARPRVVLEKSYTSHKDGIWSVAFSRDGNHVASGSWDGTIHIRNIITGKLVPLKGHTGPVRVVLFSPDGRWLVSGSNDRSIRFWDWEKGKEIEVIQLHNAAVTSLAFHPDGDWLFSGSGDQSIRLHDLRYLKPSQKIEIPRYSRERDQKMLENMDDPDLFATLFRRYAHVLGYRLDAASLELIEEPPKFYLTALAGGAPLKPDSAWLMLRRPRADTAGIFSWVLNQNSATKRGEGE